MFEIKKKEVMAEGTIFRLDIEAPEIARSAKAGQFVILMPNKKGARIPITISESNPENGTITVFVQVVGKTSALLGSLEEGDVIENVTGPLGNPAEIKKLGTILLVGGGTGIAIFRNIAKAFKEKGNYLVGIIGARDKELLILEQEMRYLCDELIITTDNGSYGEKGFVTQPMERYIQEHPDEVKLVYAIGPIIMMKNVTIITKKYNIKTMVSLNPIMVDGTGMCGACRVSIGGETKFCCVDGPDFDGHLVDFDELQKRNMSYLKEEKISLLHSIRK